MAISEEKKRLARTLFLKQWTVAEIAAELKIAETTLRTWREAEKWDDFVINRTPQEVIAARICVLSEKENKTKLEIEELDKLIKSIGDLAVKLASAKWIEKTGVIPSVESKANGEKSSRSSGKSSERKKAAKNDVSCITEEMLMRVMQKYFSAAYYQLWWKNKDLRTRFILKSRQIGATFYFAFEAFADAVLTGRNQVFLSASRNQVEVFKANILFFCKEEFDLDLKGTDFIQLSNNAQLRFLSTNATTANSYTGNLYIDEVFTMPNFEKINKMAGGISSQNRWHKTYFSIPLSISHPAYEVWSGKKFNQGKSEKKRVKFDIKYESLTQGVMFPDNIWRHAINVVDAIAQGFTLHTLEMIKADGWSDAEFKNLFMCEFIDDSRSVFRLSDLLACCEGTEELEEWPDYKKNAQRPFGYIPVTVGADPSSSGDGAAICILECPKNLNQPFRLLHFDIYRNTSHIFQANRIKDIVESHNVVTIGIDATTIGVGVYENVREFYPRAIPFYYSIEVKTRLILKMIDLVESRRIRFLSKWDNVVRAFLMITQQQCASGALTYVASREKDNHADIVFAIAGACLGYEDLAPRGQSSKAFIN